MWYDDKGLTLKDIYYWLLQHGARRRSTGREWSLAVIHRAIPVGRKLLAEEGAGQLQAKAQQLADIHAG
jgi:hypothetical protein